MNLQNIGKIFFVLFILSAFLFPQGIIVSQPRIAILYSELTEKIDYSNSNKIIDVITAWELFLMQENIPYAVIYDDDLESGIEDDFDILILPSVKYISDNQFEELQKFLGNGGSIISSGSKLFFRQNGLNEYQNLESLFGLSNLEAIPSDNISFLHSIIPNHLNQFKLDGEIVLQITNKNQALFCDVIKNNTSAYGYIFNNKEANANKSSLIYGTVGTGRFLWTGFDINDVIGGSEDLWEFKRLILNSLNWMDKKTDIYIENFTESLSSPVIVNLQYNNALEPELIDVLQKNNIKPNLIVNSDQRVLKEIINNFSSDEIILDLSQNNLLTPSAASVLIDNFNKEYSVSLSTIIVQKQFLKNIDLNLIQTAGINKVLYIEQVPGIPKYINKDFLSIPFVNFGSDPTSSNVINFLNYNPKVDCEVNAEDELLEKINQLKSQQFNFITLNELAKWWNVRERITYEIKIISDTEMELLVTNKSSVVINGLNIFLNITNKIDRKTLTISLNNSLLEYYFDNTSGAVVIRLDKIPPSSLSKIKINFTLD